jgi:hypothetical protein
VQEDSAATHREHSAASQGLCRDSFHEAVVAIALHLHPDTPPEQATQRLCDRHLSLPLPASEHSSKTKSHVPYGRDAVSNALLSTSCFSFCTNRAQRRWLKHLFLMFATTQQPSAGNSAASFTCMTPDGLAQLCKDLGLQPKHLTANDVVSVFRASRFSMLRKLCDIGTSPPVECERLNFEEFLDAFCRIALFCGGYKSAGPQPGLSFGENYSTDAKRLWVAEAQHVCLHNPLADAYSYRSQTKLSCRAHCKLKQFCTTPFSEHIHGYKRDIISIVQRPKDS